LIILTEEKGVRADMRKKDNLFKALMAYKYWVKGKEDEEARKEEMQRVAALRELEERTNYEKDNMEMQMQDMVSNMTDLYDHITEISGFKEAVRSDIQLVKDLWLYTITKIVQLGYDDSFETEEVAQDIMDKLEVDHEVSVSDHLNSMEWNEKYRAYIESAFGENFIYPGLFWEMLACMNGREERNGDDVTIHFVKKYLEFLMALGKYLNLCNQKVNYDELIQEYINEFFDKQRGIGDKMGQYPDQSLLNPLINNAEE
jgi:hypothetical protein